MFLFYTPILTPENGFKIETSDRNWVMKIWLKIKKISFIILHPSFNFFIMLAITLRNSAVLVPGGQGIKNYKIALTMCQLINPSKSRMKTCHTGTLEQCDSCFDSLFLLQFYYLNLFFWPKLVFSGGF